VSADVTQADREAAAKIFEYRGKFLMAEYVRAGAEDSSGTVQIVAAHRRVSVAAVEEKNAAILKKLRSDVFEILRRHDVSDQCFAEVAAVTHAALVGKEQ
jgi:hypothetical protein